MLFLVLGDRILGAGSCAGLPIFFTRKSGLIAVYLRENISLLPEDLEDSLASSIADSNYEVIIRWNTCMSGRKSTVSQVSLGGKDVISCCGFY